MRIRTIKPDFWTNERMAATSPFTRLLAIALLNWADDDGYFIANPPVIRGALFPYSTSCNEIHGGLTELQKIDYLRLQKSNDGRLYGFIVNFKKHQKINRPNDSSIKGLCDFTSQSAIEFSEYSVSTHGVLTAGREWKGMEGNGDFVTAQNRDDQKRKVLQCENHSATQTANDERIADANGTGIHRDDSGKNQKRNGRPKKTAPYNCVKLWCDAFRDKYHANPTVTGRDAGILTTYAIVTPELEFVAIIKRYLWNGMRDINNAGHPVGLLAKTWNRWKYEVRNAAATEPPKLEPQDDDAFFKLATGGVVPT